ncbi:MAG: hypothetical protein R2694_07940 [Ilumatobacteraceae bacterium]
MARPGHAGAAQRHDSGRQFQQLETPLRLATLVLLLGASLWLATRPRRVAPLL